MIVEASKKSKPQLILIYFWSIHFLWDGSKPTQPKSFINNSTQACVKLSCAFRSSNKKPFIYLAGTLFNLAKLIKIWAKSWHTPLPCSIDFFAEVLIEVEPETYFIDSLVRKLRSWHNLIISFF